MAKHRFAPPVAASFIATPGPAPLGTASHLAAPITRKENIRYETLQAMNQPIVHDYLSQIFVKHYELQPKAAAEEAMRFLEILQLYDMELIIGDWRTQPRSEKSLWEKLMEEAAEREPWLAKELRN